MIDEWLAALEATTLATALGRSVWAYPLVNAAHILGVALLVGAIVPLDLRLIGFWRSVPLAILWHILSRTAAAGLVIAICAGALLFITRAGEYAESRLFLLKMLVVLAGLVNIAIVRQLLRRKQPAGALSLRLARAFSLLAWLMALLLGRLVGYF